MPADDATPRQIRRQRLRETDARLSCSLWANSCAIIRIALIGAVAVILVASATSCSAFDESSEGSANPGIKDAGAGPSHDLISEARDLLGDSLGLLASDFEFEKASRVVWDDECMNIVWPGRQCGASERDGWRMRFASPGGQPQFVHASDRGDLTWAPISEVTGVVVAGVRGDEISLDPLREFPSELRMVPGSTVLGKLEPGATVFVAASSGVESSDPRAPIVILVVLEVE